MGAKTLICAGSYKAASGRDLASLLANIERCGGELLAVVPDGDNYCVVFKI